MIELQKNNPLHGVKLEVLLTELVEHYGWEILAQAININCFKSNPSIKSSLKFLRRTEWAREKVESFYLYKYKRLPKPDDDQYELPPRDRAIPLNQKPRSPALIVPVESKAVTSHQKNDTNKPRLKKLPEKKKLRSGKPIETTSDVWSHWRKESE